jgi:hypothetical protein
VETTSLHHVTLPSGPRKSMLYFIWPRNTRKNTEEKIRTRLMATESTEEHGKIK